MVRRIQVLVTLSCCLLAGGAEAGAAGGTKTGPWADADHVLYTPARDTPFANSLNKAGSLLTYHGGPTMTSPARLVYIFWGPSFCVGGADRTYATSLQPYRNQLGGTPEWAVLQQYNIPPTDFSLGTADLFDCTTPPVKVTDAIVQSKVNAYLSTHTFNPNTMYQVVIPRTSYSSSGTSTSCGGPSLAYCSYHGWMGSGMNAIKYTVQPFPSCAGCKVSGWTDVLNQEHFVEHEAIDVVTNPTGMGWYDSSGNGVADKCTWSPSPFIGTGGYGYQYVWSNANGACVRSR